MAEGSSATQASQQPRNESQNMNPSESQQLMELEWVEISNEQLTQMTSGQMATKHEQTIGFINDTMNKIQ